MGEIVLYLEIFNFKTFRSEIFQIFELLIWKINDFINSLWLYQTCRYFFTVYWICPPFCFQMKKCVLNHNPNPISAQNVKKKFPEGNWILTSNMYFWTCLALTTKKFGFFICIFYIRWVLLRIVIWHIFWAWKNFLRLRHL